MNEATFSRQILDHLNQQCPYVLLNRHGRISGDTTVLDILLQKQKLELLLQFLRQANDIKGVTLSTRYHQSQISVEFKNGEKTLLNLIHKFVFSSMIYMNESALLERRIIAFDGINVPCIEHQFEYAVLTNFLTRKGLEDWQYRYFKSFHILLIEDLLEFFNIKYNTFFNSLSDLLDFSEKDRQQMLKFISNAPANHFFKNINIRWHNFMGVVKQARII